MERVAGRTRPSRVTLRTPNLARPSGSTRHAVEYAAALRAAGVDTRVEQEWKLELRLGRRWLGGAVSGRLGRLWPPRRRDIVHATVLYCNPSLRPADLVTVQDLMPVTHPELYGMDAAGSDAVVAQVARALRHGHVHTSTQHVKDEVRRLVPEAKGTAGGDRIHVVPHGLDLAVFRPDRGPESAFRAGRMNVLVVAPPERRKRVDLLLQAAAALAHVDVVHVGARDAPPAHRAALEATRRAGKALERDGRYRHLGPVNDGRLRRLLSKADLVVAPSVAEGFGWPPLEALACGARVLASDIPPHREVLGGQALYTPLEEEALRDALAGLWDAGRMREELFPPLEERLAHAATYAWSNVVERMLPVYDEVRKETRAT